MLFLYIFLTEKKNKSPFLSLFLFSLFLQSRGKQMTENELKFDDMPLLESKRQECIVQVSLEVKPEQDSDTSGSEYEETSDMTEPAPIVSPDEDWQLVSNVESIKTLINIPNYYEMIMSKLNRQLKQDVRNNSKPLKEKLDTDWGLFILLLLSF